MGSNAESKAYIKYQNNLLAGERQSITGLYALQLEGWERSLKQVGKDPKEDMRVVISSQVKSDPNVTRDLLGWLGLAPQHHEIRKGMMTKYTSVPIDPKFKEYAAPLVMLRGMSNYLKGTATRSLQEVNDWYAEQPGVNCPFVKKSDSNPDM